MYRYHADIYCEVFAVNVGNIRRNEIEWEGIQAIQNDKDFVQFNSPEYGFRAMARTLRSYQRRGVLTVRDIINTYAPASENHTANYIRFVARRLDVSPDQPLEVNRRMFELIKAITVFENGSRFENHYDDTTIQDGIVLA
ncbi:hypothetical protein [Agarilytica rhodophyticola]|uniref:hypothetical protein n=1 Tax=Agarilytica rhodophyticola TaxID=1737490 RepID=UPI000B345EE4|nr:hypothetical protein [Agarilytica rhodophyticola]